MTPKEKVICPIEVCDNKYVWKDRLFNVTIAIMIGAGATIFGMGKWKADIDNNMVILTEDIRQTQYEVESIKKTINEKLDTLLSRIK
jgi:hypothetical protein